MDHKKLFRGIIVVLLMLIYAGCSSMKLKSIPTNTPSTASFQQACPTSTSQLCPTAIPLLPILDSWFYDFHTNYVNVLVTFEAGDICKIDQLSPVVSSQWGYEIVVNDNIYINYIVAAVTLDPGKTLADLEEYHRKYPTNVDAPPFVKEILFFDVNNPMSRTYHGVNLTGEPLYFVCFVEGPVNEKLIEQWGPVELVP